MTDLAAPGALLAQTLNLLDPDAGASALTLSHNELLARIVNAVSDGPDVSRLRLSETALLAALLTAVGGSGSNLTMSRGQLLAAINNTLSDGADLSPLTTSEAALFDAAFRLVGGFSGGGGEEGTATGLPFSLDFLNGVYTANDGEPSSLAVLFGEDAVNWGNWLPTQVQAGVGLVGGFNAAPIFAAPTLTELLVGATYVARVVVAEDAPNTSGALQIDHFDAPDYTFQRIVAFGAGDGVGSYLGDGGQLETFDGFAAGTTHLVAFTITPTHMAVSLDGGSVVSTDLSAPGAAANEAGFGVGTGVTCTLLTAQAAVDDAELPALAGGGGQTNIGGFPNSSATPPAPTTLWSADFANGVYEMDGSAATLGEMFVEDLNYAGWDAVANVHAGQGAFFCGPTATPELMALMLGGATFVITGTPTTQTVGQFIGAINFANGFDVWDQDCDLHMDVSEVAGELGNPTASDAVSGSGLPDLAPFKIAATLRGNHVAFSINGGEVFAVGPIAGDWADMTAWGIDCTRFYLAQIDCLTWRADADLPALSATGGGEQRVTGNGDTRVTSSGDTRVTA